MKIHKQKRPHKIKYFSSISLIVLTHASIFSTRQDPPCSVFGVRWKCVIIQQIWIQAQGNHLDRVQRLKIIKDGRYYKEGNILQGFSFYN